jgi:hypothetical protein
MIARAQPPQPPFKPSEPQRKIKKILEDITGMGVKIIPTTTPLGATITYMFKCGFSDPDAGPEAKAGEVHACHDYLKKLLMEDTKMNYDQLSISLTTIPGDKDESMYPYTALRFSNVMGAPTQELEALETAREMQRRLNAHVAKTVTPAQLAVYQQRLKGSATFKDGYADELGR